MKAKLRFAQSLRACHARKKTAFIFLLALLFCIPANAQQRGDSTLIVILEAAPGARLPAIFTDGFESGATRLLDANGDGTPDLILTREDNDGMLLSIRVVDLVSGNTLWEVQDVPQTLGFTFEFETAAFLGFADPDADGEPEAIFAGEQGVMLINPSDNSLAWGTVLTDLQLVIATDLTGDGYEEIILYMQETQVVQVWSRAP